MAKTDPKQTQPRKPRLKRTPRVLGVTRDGVRILRSGPGTHFTEKEAREAVAAVLAAKH
jgi:hypothetical protein